MYDALVGAGRTVSLLAHVLPSPTSDDDAPAVAEFAATHAPEAEILRPTSLTHVRSLLAGASLVVGSRMHACLNALSVGTPAVPLAYSRKFAPLMADLGWPHVIDLRSDAADAPERLVELAGRAELRSEVVTLRERAYATLDLATESLAGLRPDARPANRAA